MGVFDEVKERVTAREVMERAGIVFNRNNMCRCPFHQDRTASMKVKPTDKKYFCFGCGEKGDAIDFVAKYYNRSPREAAMQIADEFGIIYDSSVRSPPKPVRREKSPMQILEETKTKTYRVLSDYLHLLKEWDNEWQKSPNVLLALCPENPKELYKIKNIPAGAAGQEINLLAEQNKEKYSGQICETPIDYLRAKQQQEDKITLYRVTIENGNLKIMTDEL